MAGPVASYIQLPDDSGNSGKKVRSQTKVISGSTVHEHFFTPVRAGVLLGVYRLGMAQQTIVQTAHDGTSTAFLWFHMPTAITNKKARIRGIWFDTQLSSVAAAMVTAPRVSASRFTFTGTASGGSVTPVKVDTSWATSVSDLRTAVTGLTVALVGVMGTAGVAGSLTAVGAYAPARCNVFGPTDQEDEWPV